MTNSGCQLLWPHVVGIFGIYLLDLASSFLSGTEDWSMKISLFICSQMNLNVLFKMLYNVFFLFCGSSAFKKKYVQGFYMHFFSCILAYVQSKISEEISCSYNCMLLIEVIIFGK